MGENNYLQELSQIFEGLKESTMEESNNVKEARRRVLNLITSTPQRVELSPPLNSYDHQEGETP